VPLSLNVNSDNNAANHSRRFNLNAAYDPHNDAPMALVNPQVNGNLMKTYISLYSKLCSYDNLELALKKCRKRKTQKNYVMEFEEDIENNLKNLKYELESFTYLPSPMTNFVVRDPKTRKISASHFIDRVVYHALCNIIAPIFEKQFINDSFANQINKGTHAAIKRTEKFIRKVSTQRKSPVFLGVQLKLCPTKQITTGFALKADVRHYFDTVDHKILMGILERNIKDRDVIWLIKLILSNHDSEIAGKGMPLGNLTSQFFANVYLNELDQFVKHKLKAKYYIRYVDDFVIFHKDKLTLEKWKMQIDSFLRYNLKLQLHPEKSSIIPINRGITLLGFRIFRRYRLLKKSNAKRIWKRLDAFKKKYDEDKMSQEQIVRSLDGWITYAKFANTYNFRNEVIKKAAELFFQNSYHP